MEQWSFRRFPIGAEPVRDQGTHFRVWAPARGQVAVVERVRGSQATGARLHTLTSPAELRAMTALLLLAPPTPMLFQGQEFAASAPFLYFADHTPALASVVDCGRRQFLAQFPSIARPEMQRVLARASDPATFERCKLDWRERDTHQEIYVLHQDLLQLRHTDPAFSQQRADRTLVDQYAERVLIGEIYLPIRRLVAYYGPADNGAHLPFNFQLITLPWDARRIAAAISEYEGALPPQAWPNWVLGNHDQPRIASRVGVAQARVAAMLLLTLRGTPTLYYGDEIGMRDGVLAPEEFQDPQGKNIGLSRDPQRTPMQWSSAPGAGFTTGTPWLPLASDYATQNVEQQRQDPTSMLRLYQRLIALRRSEPALSMGTYTPVVAEGAVLAYIREAQGKRFLIVLNLGPGPGQLELAAIGPGQIVVATETGREQHRVADRLRLTGDDGVVIALDMAG